MARAKRHFLPGHKSLIALLQVVHYVELKEVHGKWIEEALRKPMVVRDSKWTQSIAVGDKPFVEQIKQRNLGDVLKF